jgi:hypothetical protein
MTTTTNAVHPFSHLGQAPYRFLGLETLEDREAKNQDKCNAGEIYTTNMSGGSCDHCGTEISNVCRFVSADGKRFKVGCDCAEKALDNESDAVAKRAVDYAHRKHQGKIRKVRALRNYLADKAAVEAMLPALAAVASPNRPAETAADWAQWMLANAGKAGVSKCRKMAQKILAA